MRRLLAFFAMFLFLRIVEDGGGGGEEPIDFVIDDDPTPPESKKEAGGDDKTPHKGEPKKEPKSDNGDKKPELDEETKKKLEKVEELAEFKREQDIKEAINSAVSSIKEGHPDFDIEQVASYLKDLNEKNPAKAEMLNNPAGWELIHLKHFAKDAEGVFDPGRGKADEPFEFEKVQKKALTGDKKAMAKLLANSK